MSCLVCKTYEAFPVTTRSYSDFPVSVTSYLCSMNKSLNGASFYRNADIISRQQITATNSTPSTDISSTTIRFEVWDYSTGVARNLFEKTNGSGVSILTATPTEIWCETKIAATEWAALTPVLPDRDLELVYRIWATIDGSSSPVEEGKFISRKAIPVPA